MEKALAGAASAQNFLENVTPLKQDFSHLGAASRVLPEATKHNTRGYPSD